VGVFLRVRLRVPEYSQRQRREGEGKVTAGGFFRTGGLPVLIPPASRRPTTRQASSDVFDWLASDTLSPTLAPFATRLRPLFPRNFAFFTCNRPRIHVFLPPTIRMPSPSLSHSHHAHTDVASYHRRRQHRSYQYRVPKKPDDEEKMTMMMKNSAAGGSRSAGCCQLASDSYFRACSNIQYPPFPIAHSHCKSLGSQEQDRIQYTYRTSLSRWSSSCMYSSRALPGV